MAETVEKTIESVLQQDYPNIEHIVMDGGSTDGTLDIVRAYEDHLTWYSQPDEGQSDAINKGLALTSGMYLNWFNADDFLLPGAIHHMVELFKANPGVGLVYGRVNHIALDGNKADDRTVRDGMFEELLNWDNFISQPGCLFTREAWEMFGPLDIDLHYAMDWDLWIKMWRKFSFKYTPQTLAEVTVHKATKSSSGGLRRYDEIRHMLEGHGGSAAHIYYKIGREYYERNQMREARRYFRIALSKDPSSLIRRHLIAMIPKSYLGGHVMDLARATRTRFGF
jgi:glycosyltransferase involved in cell wall biosynthesis